MRRRRTNLPNELSDLARELRLNRPEPRDQVLRSLMDGIRNSEKSAPSRRAWRRGGLAIAMSGLIVVAIASFGGIGYAGSAASDAVKKVQRSARPTSVAAPSAAQSQYGEITPPSKPASGSTSGPSSSGGQKPSGKPTAGGGQGTAGNAAGAAAAAAQATTKQGAAAASSGGALPFTGLALWIPLAAGLVLIAFGLILRTRGRRRESAA